MADSYTREVFTDSPEQTAAAFGTLDANIRAVEDAFGAVYAVRTPTVPTGAE